MSVGYYYSRNKVYYGSYDLQLTKNQKAVYEILTEDGKKSLQEVADEAGISLAGVKKICLKLQEYGVLERVGSKKDGFWVTK